MSTAKQWKESYENLLKDWAKLDAIVNGGGDVITRDGETTKISITDDDTSADCSNPAVEVTFPDGSVIMMWSDGDIIRRQPDGTETTLSENYDR